MKRILWAVVIVLAIVSNEKNAICKEDIPSQFFAYGIVDNGNRYEQIIGMCVPSGVNKIQCKLKSTYIRLKNTQKDEKPNKKDIENFTKFVDEFCTKINKNEYNDYKEKNLNDYDKEIADTFVSLCKKEIDVYQLLEKQSELKINTCTASSKNWDAEFTKNRLGEYEFTSVSELFITGIQKAMIQKIYKAKDAPILSWNFSIEASYMGTPADGKTLPEPYKNVYSWKKISPVKLPCKYISIEIL